MFSLTDRSDVYKRQAPYYVSSWQQQAVSELTKKDTNYYNYIWDNILTYNNQWGKHNFGAMLGYSMRQQQYRYMLSLIHI